MSLPSMSGIEHSARPLVSNRHADRKIDSHFSACFAWGCVVHLWISGSEQMIASFVLWFLSCHQNPAFRDIQPAGQEVMNICLN